MILNVANVKKCPKVRIVDLVLMLTNVSVYQCTIINVLMNHVLGIIVEDSVGPWASAHQSQDSRQ